MILAGEPLKYSGKILNLPRGFRLHFQLGRARMPIFLASLTSKSMAQTTRIADGWMPVLIPLEHLGRATQQFLQLVQEAGRDLQSVIISAPGSLTVTRDIDKARQESKAHLAFDLTNMGDYYRDQLMRMGHEEAVTVVRHTWEAGGHTAGIAAVPDALVENLFFAGPVEACVDRLEAQAEAGIDLHTVHVAMEDPQEAARSFAKLVG
jgi:alkanesulfonate monooxygenase SsuD/methylene tetrahydromethanopterin reductase-like flavin-dependent oxidoreductase (luciferase family)